MEKHRAIAERAFALMNSHNLDQLAELFADTCELQMPGVPTSRGSRAFGEMVKGWVAAEWGSTAGNRRARYYRMTRAGRRQLETELAQFERITGAIVRILQTT